MYIKVFIYVCDVGNVCKYVSMWVRMYVRKYVCMYVLMVTIGWALIDNF